MKRMIIAAASMVALSASFAFAEMKALSGAEIEALLKNNTTYGVWDGVEYRQFFSGSTATAYYSKGNKPSFGIWRINDKGTKMQTNWGGKKWPTYGISKEGDKYFWVEDDGSNSIEFFVMDGMELDFK